MKTLKTTSVVLLLIIGMASCEQSDPFTSSDILIESYDISNEILNMGVKVPKATGEVEFLWKGAEKGSDMGDKPENLLAFFSFNAHEGNAVKDPKGEIIYQVTNPDLTPHREIRAVVTEVKVIDKRAWFVGVVISDTKGCLGDGNGGHNSNCSSSDHSGGSGGCGEETDGHDGGCSDGGTDEDGCSDGGTDEGGCSDTGTDGGMGEEGQGSGSPGGSMGNPLSGKNCRLGQIIAVKVHDLGKPGILDGLTWKWFSQNAEFVPAINNIDDWPHLCKKTIVGGNLTVHE